MAELMAGIGHRDRLHSLRYGISGKNARQRLGVELADIESQLCAERVIESKQTRLGDRHRVDSREQAFRQSGIAAAIQKFE